MREIKSNNPSFDCHKCKNSFLNPFDQHYCEKGFDLQNEKDCNGVFYKDKSINKKRKCPATCKHSEFFKKTFTNLSDNREYWLFTEAFCYLHGGKDYCDCAN